MRFLLPEWSWVVQASRLACRRLARRWRRGTAAALESCTETAHAAQDEPDSGTVRRCRSHTLAGALGLLLLRQG